MCDVQMKNERIYYELVSRPLPNVEPGFVNDELVGGLQLKMILK
jgi:hypothetical protein